MGTHSETLVTVRVFSVKCKSASAAVIRLD